MVATLPLPAVPQAALRVHDHAAPPSRRSRLFVNEAARQALERRLAAVAGGPVNLAVTDGRARVIDADVVPVNGVRRVRLHHMFLDAPGDVQEELAHVLFTPGADRSVVDAYYEANEHRVRAAPPRCKLVTRGSVHDLAAIYEDVNRRFFAGAADVHVTWGRRYRPRSSPRKGIDLAMYEGGADRLVRVHRVLDQRWVPRYFVSFVVYHELLHAIHDAERTAGGRVSYHTQAFVDAERAHPHYQRACTWEAAHLQRLLRS